MPCQKSVDKDQVKFLIFKDIGLSFIFLSFFLMTHLSHKNTISELFTGSFVSYSKGKMYENFHIIAQVQENPAKK